MCRKKGEIGELSIPQPQNVGNIYEIPRFVRNVKLEKNMQQKKTITQNIIYMIRQFTYIHRVVVILLFIEKKKNTKYGSIVFLSQNCIPNSNLKQWYFYCAQRIHNRLKMSNKYYQGQTQKKKKKNYRGQAFASWNKFKKISR